MKAVLLVGLFAFASCAAPQVVGARLPSRTLQGTDGAAHVLPSPSAKLTVLEFFSDHCPCQAAHDARLRDLYARYHPSGVEFFAVDSENAASLERDGALAAARHYPYPILVDRGAGLAWAVGATSATETLVVDRDGTVQYQGGIDSDRSHLRDDATPYLRDAIDDLLGGHLPRQSASKALGCALQTR